MKQQNNKNMAIEVRLESMWDTGWVNYTLWELDVAVSSFSFPQKSVGKNAKQ